MSDLLKKFKSVFIIEDEPAKTTPSAPSASNDAVPAAQNVAAAPQATVPAAPRTASYTPGGNVTDRFVQILMAALEKSNQAGFDYFEFRQSLLNLAKMPMDEQTRFHSAYAMAQTMGVTPEKLVESGKFYLGVLNNEQSKFNDAHAQQRTKLIGSREAEAQNLDAVIRQKAEQIRQLTQQIEEHRIKKDQLQTEINESTVKIENTKADFDVTFASVVAQIQDDLRKIQQYLK